MEIADAFVIKRLHRTAKFTDGAPQQPRTTTCISSTMQFFFDVTLMDFLLRQAITYLAFSFK